MPLPGDSASDIDFLALTRKIAADRDFRCGSYKERCLRRRIAVRMRARGVHTYRDYMRLLDQNPQEYDLLIDALTINVTKLFRNWDAYAAIAEDVVPALWERSSIRVWSAGCASGEEPYSLGVMFHRHAERLAQLDRLDRLAILATDIDRGSLERASRGRYDEGAFADTPAHLRARYFPAGSIGPEVRELVRFNYRDMLREDPPLTQADLIVCRNVIIYFDRDTQEVLFEKFVNTLAPGGFLVLGKVETLLGVARAALETVHARARIFRKP
jgi:chemotaxis methyl-accepting protein methylase